MTLTVNGKPKRFCLPKELKAAKTLAVVMGAFLVCWLPFFLVNIIYAVCRVCQTRINMEHIMLTKWLHYLNSLLNPIIYGCLNRDFRTAFKKLSIYVIAKLLRQSSSLEIQSSARSGRLSSRVLTDVH
ncbi:5-hydroxytryptamine receptor 1D [Exaiptasia diaphana]|nr:5-hydroxytryptamine receptor 1D [Exaiptasia diaphana]